MGEPCHQFVDDLLDDLAGGIARLLRDVPSAS